MALPLDEIRRGIEYWRGKKASEVPVIPRGHHTPGGATIHVLEAACDGEQNRKIVMLWLFPDIFKDCEIGQVSTKILDDIDFHALFRFVGAYKDEYSAKWIGRRGLEEECSEIWFAQMQAMGQMVLIPAPEEGEKDVQLHSGNAETSGESPIF